jgi:DNA-binding transcriptional MerR regulator
MDLHKLTIGQMAELNHVSEQTLRLYDREKLLIPDYIDPNTSYRYYHITQSAQLDLIQSLKTYGMTLRQIRSYLAVDNIETCVELLEKQAEEIDGKIENLRLSREAVLRSLGNYERYRALPKNGEIFIEYIPRRHIYRYKCGTNFFEQDESGYEYMLRQLKTNLVENDLPLSYFTNIGTIIRRDKITAGELYSDEVFMFAGNGCGRDLETIQAASYICLCSSEFADERNNIASLLSYIKEHKYEITGDYICEVILDFPLADSKKRQMFYKTQIPVRFDK